MALVGTRTVPQDPTARLLATVGAAGLALALGGQLGDRAVLVGVGLALVGVGALAAAIAAPALFLLVFVVVRPMLDLGPTYGRGVDVNAPAGVLALAAVVSWTLAHRTELTRLTRSSYAAIAFAVAALLSAAGAPTLGPSVNAALRVVTVAVLFLFAQQVARLDPRFTPRLIAAVLASTVLAAAVAVLQIAHVLPLPAEYRVLQTAFDSQLSRPPGPYPAPTVLGTHLCIGLAMCLYLLPRAWASARWRTYVPHLAALMVLFGWVLLENKSRGSAIGVLIVAGVVLSAQWRTVGVALFAIVLLAGAVTLNNETTRLDEFGTQNTPGAESDTLAWRVGYWERNLSRVWDSPVTGIGLGTVEQRNPEALPPHSTAVQSIVEMGFAGAAAYLGLIACLALDLAARLRQRRRTGARDGDLVLVVASLCVAYLWMGLFENLLTQVVTSGTVALLAGVVLFRDEPDPVETR